MMVNISCINVGGCAEYRATTNQRIAMAKRRADAPAVLSEDADSCRGIGGGRVHPARVQHLVPAVSYPQPSSVSAGSASSGPGPVLLWMSRDQRVHDNWALLHAQDVALHHKVPLGWYSSHRHTYPRALSTNANAVLDATYIILQLLRFRWLARSSERRCGSLDSCCADCANVSIDINGITAIPS
jgi:hypothetical protein